MTILSPPGEDTVTIPRAVTILGVRVDDVTYDEAVAIAEALIDRGGAHQFATVNPEFIMAAQRDEDFRAVLARTALNVPDGIGVVWAARRRGVQLRERVAGVDLMQALCALASRRQWRVFFLGAQPGVAEQVAAQMVVCYPGLTVAGTYAGTPGVTEELAIGARIRAARPQLLFVAYGAPAQDKWLARNLPLILPEADARPGILGMGVGGAFDFVAGVQKRAPLWLQRLHLEWLYRLIRQPWRWRRQTALLRFAVSAMLESR